MKTTLALLTLLMTVCGSVEAQVVPAATGPAAQVGKLNYALRYSESAESVSGQPNWQTGTTSGTLEYTNKSERRPFTMEYGGGYTFTFTGPTYETGQFHHLFLSQDFLWRKWRVSATNDASYLPQAPITGFTGIPGIGELIGVTTPAPPTDQTILSLNSHVLENQTIASLDHSIGSKTTVNLGGGYEILRYPNSDGLDTTTVTGNAEITQQISGRNSILARYMYQNFSYPGYSVTFSSDTGLFGFSRKWTRDLTMDISVGPQYNSSSFPGYIPNTITTAASANFTYLRRSNTFGLNFTRGSNGGAGYLLGSEVDTVSGNYSKLLGVNGTFGLTGGYEQTDALNNNGAIKAAFGTAEGSWRLGQSFIVFANYTGTYQTGTETGVLSLPTTALNAIYNVVGFGIGYSPRQNNHK